MHHGLYAYLSDPNHRQVVDVANHIMQGSAFLYRMQSLKIQGLQIQDDYCQYYPLRSTLLGVK